MGIPSESVARIAQGKGRVVIASSRDSEQSWESEQYQNSYFTHFILEGLGTSEGKLSVTQIFTYLQRTVPRTVLAEKKAQQNPTMDPQGRNVNVYIGTAIE